MSLIACGMPCIQAIGPVGVVPRFNCPSRSSASRSSTSPSRRLTIALCTGLTDSMRARVARITSRHETWRLRIALERACAGRSVMSMPLLWPVRMHSDNQLTHDRLADCLAQAVQRPSSWVGSRPLNVTVAVRPAAVVNRIWLDGRFRREAAIRLAWGGGGDRPGAVVFAKASYRVLVQAARVR